MSAMDLAQDALNRLSRAQKRGTGCYLSAEMIQALHVTSIGEIWSTPDPRTEPAPQLTRPPAPWPIGSETNSKRAGWAAFFAGTARDASPFPPARPDLTAGYREGWDAAASAAAVSRAAGEAIEQAHPFGYRSEDREP